MTGDRSSAEAEEPPCAFETLRESTYCPFAKRSRIRFSPSWNNDLGFDANIAEHAQALADFVDQGKAKALHGFVSQVWVGDAVHDFEQVRRSFAAYLNGLAEHDADCRKSLDEDKSSKDWQFSFGGMRMFLNVFAPCYPQPHSKFIASRNLFWVFFQPEYSFDLCGIDSTKNVTKRGIRAAFRDAGMAYDGAQIDRRIEALLYMFPRTLTDQPVRWWE